MVLQPAASRLNLPRSSRERTVRKLEQRRAHGAAMAKVHRCRRQRLLRGWQAATAQERRLRQITSEVCTVTQMPAPKLHSPCYAVHLRS